MARERNQQHRYRVLEEADLYEQKEVKRPTTAGTGVSGGTTGPSGPAHGYDEVAAFIDHGVVSATSAHQARVQVFEKLDRDEADLIVVRENNMLEDTLKKEARFDIVSVSGQRRAKSRAGTGASGQGATGADGPPGE